MINLKSYVVMKEELDGDNIQWKFDNWSKGIESSALDAFMKEAPNQKDIEAFKKLVDDSGINFNALTDMMNDDAKGLPDNYDNIYILKKIIDTINILNKGKNDFAKIIEESPINIECKVKEIKELGSHDMFLAEVVCVNVDKKYFDDTNKFDMSKCGLIAYMHGKYYELGNELGKFGFSVKKK